MMLMNKAQDTLYIIGVADDLAAYTLTSHGIPPSIYADAQERAKRDVSRLLHKYGRICDASKIKHYLLMGVSNHVGELITQAVDKKRIDFLVLGRRGMGRIKRLFVGSTSKYCVEHCNCNVLVVKSDWHPPMDRMDLQDVMKLEEQERQGTQMSKRNTWMRISTSLSSSMLISLMPHLQHNNCSITVSQHVEQIINRTRIQDVHVRINIQSKFITSSLEFTQRSTSYWLAPNQQAPSLRTTKQFPFGHSPRCHFRE